MGELMRLNKMTRHVFTSDNVAQFRDAINDVFTIFHEILDTPCNSFSDLKGSLEMVDGCKWEAIRVKYLEDDYLGYKNGGFTSTENSSVVKILLDFIALIEHCTQSIIHKIEDKHGDTIVLENKIKQMEERIKKTDQFVELQKTHYNEKSAENARNLSRNAQMQEMVDMKNKQIAQLEKNSNVQNWENEKQKILKESKERIDQLEQEIDGMNQGRENYKRRMSNIDTSYQKMLMKQQLATKQGSTVTSSSDEGDDSSADKLSRTNFIQDKDIAYLERQLYDLQTGTVGCIGGMKTDFTKLTHKFIDKHDGLVDNEFELLSLRMNRVYDAVKDGHVEKVTQVLPPHYKYIDDENFKVKKIRRLSQPGVLPSQKVLNSILDKKPSTLSLTSSSDAHMNCIKEDAPVNPVIVNPKTKKVHPINSIKYFPHMSRQFISDQFVKFQEFDINGDGSLDLAEIVTVVKQLGFTFNTHQLQEAMEEVDRDNNHTLDFYEYLLIMDNIYRRNGKADLFKTGLTELKDKTASKTCVIQ